LDRLSPQDATFLYVENELSHMAIAALAIFDGPPPTQDEIEEMVGSKLNLVPRYRQRVRFVPMDIGRPVWCDDPHFRLRYHVRHTALPAPGSQEQLCTLVGRVMSQPLDRTKPLWEMWVVEGLSEDRWAILFKLHHSMADGVAATDLLSVLMDQSPEQEHPRPQRWQPEPDPSGLSLVASALFERMTSPREGLQALRTALETPRRLSRKLGDFADGIATYRRFTNTALESSLNGPIGPHRSWEWVSTSFADIKKIRSARGGTVNDVVLAAITRGFRALLLSRGEPVKDLVVRTLVPVSVRRDDERGQLNNRVSAMFAELPVGIADPVECLVSIQKQMNDLKEHHQAAAGENLMSLSGVAPPVLMALGARLFAGIEQHAVQTVTTNVPGPRQTLYAAGRRMRTACLYVPLAGSVRIGIAMFSYAGELTFALTADPDHAPDTVVLAEGIESGIADLLATS
jgi:WS/DGAT/MGAT family acyltransferase